MSIPVIASYPLPVAEQLPKTKVSWPVEPQRAVLLVHDMQDYFLRFYDRSAHPLCDVLQNIEKLRAQADRLGIPVVYSAQPSDPERAERKLLNDMWGPGLIAHPEQASIVREIAPRAKDLVLEKTRYSAFHRTQLLDFMRTEGRDQLWICGVFAHIGCMITACDAFMHDLKPFLVADAVADFSRAHHDMSLEFVGGRCGAVLSTAALCRACEEAPLSSRSSRVLQQLAALLQVPVSQLGPEEDLRAVGLDSVRLLELIEQLRSEGLTLSMLDVVDCETVGALLSRMETLDGAGVHA